MPNQLLDVERLPAAVGDTVELLDVLLVANGEEVIVGQPRVAGARVVAEVVEHGRDKKIVVFKYKPKTRYHKKTGHRQGYTRLAIRQILTGVEAEAIVAAEVPRKPRRPRVAAKPVAEVAAAEAPRKPRRPRVAAKPVAEVAAVEAPPKPRRAKAAAKPKPPPLPEAEAPVEAGAEPAVEEKPKPRRRKAAAPEVSVEAPVEAGVKPAVEEKPKPRRRKAAAPEASVEASVEAGVEPAVEEKPKPRRARVAKAAPPPEAAEEAAAKPRRRTKRGE